MKADYLITFRSITFAQRAQVALKRIGIENRLQRTPRTLSSRGCGYCLLLEGRDALAAVEILRPQDVDFGKVYAITATGMEERHL